MKFSIISSIFVFFSTTSTAIKTAEVHGPLSYIPKKAFINTTHYHPDGDRKILLPQDTDPCDQFYLSPFFSSDMILQREPQQAVIYGYGTPNGSVTLTLTQGSDSTLSQTFTTTISNANSKDSNDLTQCSWHIVLPAIPATMSTDDKYTIDIQCIDGCNNWESNDTISLTNIQFGDIWICTGQSNMALGVQHTYSWYNESINRTTENYNIKILKNNNIMSLTPLDSRYYIGNDNVWYDASYTNLTNLQFSAVCYYYARRLVDFWNENDIEPIPLGMIMAAWGGSIIEAWVNIDDQQMCDYRICENYIGSTIYGQYTAGTNCNSSHTTSVNEQPGSIYNGVILPYSNMTIKGALWYQGENNGINPGSWIKNQGYACLLPRLINNWRRAWIENNYATNGLDKISIENNGNQEKFKDNSIYVSTDMPFGVVSLHGWCGEEAANCYPARNYSSLDLQQPTWYNLAWLRWAQVGSLGRVPNIVMQNTFVAMAYDLGDTGAPPPPMPYQGPLHPRNKFTLGKRLALAGAAIAYNNDTVPYAGPVLSFCDVDYDIMSLNLTFDAQLLRGESIIIKHSSGFEVQTNATIGGWVATNISSVVSSNSISLDVSNVNTPYDKIIGVRYEWRDHPCCNNTQWNGGDNDAPCAEASCAVYTKNSDLPLVPFIYSINQKGECIMSMQYS